MSLRINLKGSFFLTHAEGCKTKDLAYSLNMLHYFPGKNLIKLESIFCGCYLPGYTRFFIYRSVRKFQLLSTGGNPPGNVTATWAPASNADCLGLSSKQNVLEKKEKE